MNTSDLFDNKDLELLNLDMKLSSSDRDCVCVCVGGCHVELWHYPGLALLTFPLIPSGLGLGGVSSFLP